MRHLRRPLLILLASVLAIPVCQASTFLYTVWQVESAKSRGIYSTPEDGMRASMSGYSGVERVEIEYAGTNSFDGSNPHVWFVVARTYGHDRSDGEVFGEDESIGGGSFFLRVENGWVHVPEGTFPEFVGFGMHLYGVYGCVEEGSCD